MQQARNGPRARRPANDAAALRRQRGVMAFTMPFALLTALALGAFAVDIGHLYVAQAELQTAADAAALAGAASLFPASKTGPNWSAAQSAATSAVGLNTSDGATLHDASVQPGYWNLSGTPAGMQSTTVVPGIYDAAAVQVTVSRAANLNGGPVSFFFARLFGTDTGTTNASAIAVVAAPGQVAPHALFPVAIGQCVYDQYWNAQSNSPATDASGAPYQVKIGDVQTSGGCIAGQWTSFQTDANDVKTVRGLIDNGNSTALSIGDPIWIEPGVKDSIYPYVTPNSDVLVPVVDQATTSTHQIIAFAAFHIDQGVGGNGKYIVGHFLGGFKVSSVGTGEVGPYYGAYVPPRLAR